MEWQPIAGKTVIAVDRAHRFGADALLLADFLRVNTKDTVCDLGTGCGAIAFRLCAISRPARVVGVDADETAICLADISAESFRQTPCPAFVVGDWNTPREIAPAGSFSQVVCNPPYFPPHSGELSADPVRRFARHEQEDTLEKVIACGEWLLKNGGKMSLCHRPERLAQVLSVMTRHGLEPKRIQFVQQTPQSAPWLFLAEAKKGGKPGLEVCPPRIMEDVSHGTE